MVDLLFDASPMTREPMTVFICTRKYCSGETVVRSKHCPDSNMVAVLPIAQMELGVNRTQAAFAPKKLAFPVHWKE
jgi:hypothetical protein